MTQALPPCIVPGTALGTLRKSILTAIAELIEARDEVTLALSMRAGDLHVDEAAVFDSTRPLLEAARHELALTLAEMDARSRAAAQARGEVPPAPNVVPFQAAKAIRPTDGGPNAA